MELRRRKRIQWLAAMVFAVGVLGAGGVAGWWYWMFSMPYCVRAECRGQEITVETMKHWEKREENGSLGILRMAGWRTGRRQTVISVSTARKQSSQVIFVYGSMELAIPAPVLSGRCGLAEGEGYCVVSEDLARHLFGSTDVAGECVKIGAERFVVAGVIEKEGDFLMIPAKEGDVEQLAVEFRGRMGAGAKVRGMLEE